MKNENIKKLLLPIGLLIMGSSYFTRHFTPSPEPIEDFLKGVGIVFVLSALLFKAKLRTCKQFEKKE